MAQPLIKKEQIDIDVLTEVQNNVDLNDLQDVSASSPSNQDVLTWSGTLWIPQANSTIGDTPLSIVQVTTGTHAVLSTEDVLIVDASGGNVIINLHAASESRVNPLNIKRIDASGNTVTINGAGSPAELIDGASPTTVVGQYTNATIVPDAANNQWWIL